MYKVTREVLTSTSERRSGFDTADDEFETDDDRGLKGRTSNTYRLGSRSKDFRSTDEDADIDDWQDTDTFARFRGSNTLNSNVSGRSKSATLDDKGKCTCCPYGYHVDLDFLKHLNAEEYENVINDPRYLLKHHRRLHQMQQQQFQQRSTSASTSANVDSSTSQVLQQQHQQYQQHQQQQYQQQQQQKHFQQQSHHQQQQQQQQQYHQQSSTLRSKSPYSTSTLPRHTPQPHPSREDPTYENALAVYNRSQLGGSATMSSTTRTTLGRDAHHRTGSNGFCPSTSVANGYDTDGDGTRRHESVFVAEDGSTTTKVIEEVHKTRTTIINYDTDEDEEDSPQKQPGVRAPKKPETTYPEDKEKLLPRQQHLLDLQKKLQQIQPIGQTGPMKTYVNAGDPKPVTEDDEPDENVNKIRLPNFRPRPDEEDDFDNRGPVQRPHHETDPDWLREKEELLRKIRDMEFDKLKDQRERDAYERRLRDLENEKSKLKEKVTRDTGVGDQKVDEETYTTTKHFQVVGTSGQQPVRIHEKELNTEETTEIREKEVKTIFVSGVDDRLSLAVANQPCIHQQKETKSIGVGDGNVLDDSQSRFEVHEKELRTVYLGGPDQGKVATRNVGILCKAAMRDVGMVHTTEEEKPLVKNAAVGAGEIGVSESDVTCVTTSTVRTTRDDGGDRELALRGGDDESYFASSGFCHTTLTNVKGGGLAGLTGDKLKAYLDEMLKRTVHSVGTQCQFSTENKGTDAGRVGYDIVSVGVSDDTVDVDVRPIAVMKSVAVDHRPSLFHRCVGTELIFKLDVGTNTKTQDLHSSKSTNTEPKPSLPAATMTDSARLQAAQTATELPIFFALDQLRTVGVMTDDVDMYNKRVNTEPSDETQQRIGSTMTSASMLASSASESREATEIRRGEEQATGYRRYVQETVTPGYIISHTRTSRSRTRHESGSPRRSSSGRQDGQADYTTSTVVHTRDKSPRKVTFEGGSVSTDTTGKFLGTDRTTKTSKTTGADGVTQIVTETRGPGYSEKVVKETYTSDGKSLGIPITPGMPGFPQELITHDGRSSSSRTHVSTSQSSTGLQIAPERTSRTKTVSGSSTSTTKTEIDEKTGMKRHITETRGPGYTETTIKSSYGNVEGGTFGLEFSADSSGKVSTQSVKGPYYTEKTLTTGDLRGHGGTIDLEFTAGGSQTTEDGRHYITEVQCPGYRHAQVLLDKDGSIPIQVDQSGVSMSGSTTGHVVKSTTTEKRTYSSSGGEQSTLAYGGAQAGIKTVIRESYGPDNIKTITTEKVDMKTGKVISSNTTKSRYESLPSFDSSPPSGFSKTTFDFARSGASYDRFVPDNDLGASCDQFALWLKDKSKVTQTQLTEARSMMLNRWLHIAGGEASNVHLVKSFLTYLNEISPELLKHVVNLTDENGNAALHFALSHGNCDTVEAILDTGVADVNRANSVGNNPILISALAVEPTRHNLEVLKKIYSLGNVDIRASESGQTALMLATGRGRTEVVQLLLAITPQCDVNAKDADGFTALMFAAQKGHSEIVKMLLATGKCDVLTRNNDGKAALDIAKEVGHPFIVSLLETHLKGQKK